jgi:hypothetical protein
MAHRNPNISKTKFLQTPLFIRARAIKICEIQDGEKLLWMGAILGKNLEESPIYNLNYFTGFLLARA